MAKNTTKSKVPPKAKAKSKAKPTNAPKFIKKPHRAGQNQRFDTQKPRHNTDDTQNDTNNHDTNTTDTNNQNNQNNTDTFTFRTSTPEAEADYLSTIINLQKATPIDQNGFPIYLIDHAHIPEDFKSRSREAQNHILEVAQIQLDNMEGYPAFDFHTPIWEQLENEPDAFYSAFRAYLMSPARSLQEAQNHLPTGFTPYTLRQAYHFFYWKERARAYDLLLPVAAAKLQDQRLLAMEDNHYRISHHLLNTLQDEIVKRSGEQDNRPWRGMEANELLKGLISVAELQRTSVGLPTKGPRTSNVGFRPAPHAGVSRNIREASENYIGPDNSNVSPAEKMRKDIDRAMADNPEYAAKMQEMAMQVLLSARNISENNARAAEEQDNNNNSDDNDNNE